MNRKFWLVTIPAAVCLIKETMRLMADITFTTEWFQLSGFRDELSLAVQQRGYGMESASRSHYLQAASHLRLASLQPALWPPTLEATSFRSRYTFGRTRNSETDCSYWRSWPIQQLVPILAANEKLVMLPTDWLSPSTVVHFRAMVEQKTAGHTLMLSHFAVNLRKRKSVQVTHPCMWTDNDINVKHFYLLANSLLWWLFC